MPPRASRPSSYKKGVPRPSEKKCGKLECGRCKIPNPMKTHTESHATYGLVVLLSPKYQNSIAKKFGTKTAQQKLQCEWDRVTRVLEKEYHHTMDGKLAQFHYKVTEQFPEGQTVPVMSGKKTLL